MNHSAWHLDVYQNLNTMYAKNWYVVPCSYDRQSLSVGLMKEHRHRMFENWVLRELLRPKREGVNLGW
jgi:hypothetical protein